MLVADQQEAAPNNKVSLLLKNVGEYSGKVKKIKICERKYTIEQQD